MSQVLGRSLRPSLDPSRATSHRWAWGGALVGTLVAVTLWAPASWLARAVEHFSHAQVRLDQARGTVWNGSAQLALSGGSGSSDTVALPGLLNWKIRPIWGAMRVDLQASCCTPQPLQIEARPVGFSGLHLGVADHQSQWPSSLLVGLGTPWNTVQLQGQLTLRSQALALDLTPRQLALAGQLQLDATQMSSRLSTLKPMGSYRVTLQGGTSPTLQLQTLEGSLELSGKGQWIGSRLRFEGVATAQPDRVEALSNLLNIIGRRNGARSIIQVGTL